MKIRKITALLLAAVMVLGLFSGCEKAMDAETLVQKMTEASANVTDMGGKMDMDIDMTMSVTGMSLDMGMNLSGEYRTTSEPMAGWMDMTFSMEMMGMTQEMQMVSYYAEEDGVLVSYAYDSSTDMWTCSEAEEMMDMGSMTTMDLTEIAAGNMVLAEEKQTIGDREAYVLDVTITGELLNKAMAESMEVLDGELDEEVAAMMEGMDFSAMSMKAVYYIDCETYLPLQMDIEIQGMGDALGTMINAMMSEEAMDDSVDYEFTVDVTKFTISMSELVYADVQVPTVPQEGIDAVAQNPDQGDGSYVLTVNEDSVRVVCPEGYTVYYVDSEYLAMSTDDYVTTVDYSMLVDFAEQDMLDIVEDYATSMQEIDLYESHGASEDVDGFKIMYVKCNDETVFYFAWKQVGDSMLMVTIYSEGMPDIPSALAAVEVYEG